MSGTSQLVLQWDIGSTIFRSVNQFWELIKATSQDNVQSQALLAAEALGAGLSVSDKLLGKAVDALAGQQNVKLQNMKIAVGLFSGGSVSMLRTSTPGLKAFLLITGLKMWHHDDDVGEIYYTTRLSHAAFSEHFLPLAINFSNL
jgi:hypothetical protein